MYNLFLIAIGGAFGSISRYIFIEMVTLIHRDNFPIGTILVNIIGSFFMGLLEYAFTHYSTSISPQTRFLLATGVLGGFTTFSAFSADTLRLINEHNFSLAFIYIFSSILFSILAIFFGQYFAAFLWQK